MRDYERKAIADAAYDAWRHGGDYDRAWDRAEEIIYQEQPTGFYEAEDILSQANLHRSQRRHENE